MEAVAPPVWEPVVVTSQRIIRTYVILGSTYTLAASLIWAVNTLFLLDAGLGIGEVFLANALFSAGMVVFELPTGVVADTLGRRVSFLFSIAILGLTTMLYLLAAQAEAGIVVFGAISVLMGLGFTFYSGALEAWLVDALAFVGDDEPLDHVFARSQQFNGAAMFVGTISGGFLGQLDLAVPFIGRSVLLVALFVLAASTMREIGFTPTTLEPREVPARIREQALVGIQGGWGHEGLRYMMLAGAARSAFFAWAFYAAQPYLLDLLERDAVWIIGLVIAGVSLATIVGNEIVEVLSHRCGRRSTMLLLASAVSAASAVLIGVTDSFWVAVGGLFMIAVTMGVIMPVRQAYLHAVTESDRRATVVSFDALVGSLGGVGGQVGLGRIADVRSYSAGYVVGGLFTLLALPLLVGMRRSGGVEDQILTGDHSASKTASCPRGLPRDTGIQDHPVPESVGSGR